jgi:hypothetical protein
MATQIVMKGQSTCRSNPEPMAILRRQSGQRRLAEPEISRYVRVIFRNRFATAGGEVAKLAEIIEIIMREADL